MSVSNALLKPVSRLAALEHVLLLVATVSLGWYGFVSISASREQEALARELDRVRAVAVAPRPASTSHALRARLEPRSLVGRIDVPRLKLSVLAREGADVRTLQTAVGHVPETAMPGEGGNAAFAGHRDTFFSALRDVRTGDEIVVTTPNGVYRYAVTATRVVAPSETSVLGPTDGSSLTLVTCYPFDYIGAAPERFIVRADAVAPTRRE